MRLPRSWPIARMDPTTQPIVSAIIRAIGECLRCHKTKELTAHGALCVDCMKLVAR